MQMRALILASALAFVACSGDDIDGETKRVGVDLTIEYDSSLDVRSFQYRGIFDGGRAPLEESSFDAPLFVEPPGVRVVDHAIDVTEVGVLTLAVDGLNAAGIVVGTGVTQTILRANDRATAKVRLGAPVVCGDGRVAGVEVCDDGNRIAGDGCDDRCQPEPDLGPRWLEKEALPIQPTDGPDFVDVPGALLVLPAVDPDDTWIVFVSGRMRSTSEAETAAEMRLMVDDDEVDLWGHQMNGVEDNWAGFVTFAPVPSGGDAEVRVQFRAEAGTTEVADIRIVAVRFTPAADHQLLDGVERLEARGTNVDVGTLTWTPDTPGDWIVLAKTSMSDAPGGSTVRSWLEGPDGRRWPDDGGVHFSNPRAAWVPTFAALQTTLDSEETTFALRGASSGAGATDAWWNGAYDHRERVTLTSGATVTPTGYAFSVQIDHAGWVAAGEARADAADVRVVYRGEELHRVLDPDSAYGHGDTQIWFNAARRLEPGEADDGYEIYHGRADLPEDDRPLASPASVFQFYDAFDGPELDPTVWVTVQGEANVVNGLLRVGPATLVGVGNVSFGANTIVESRSRLSSSIGEKMRWLGLFRDTGALMSFHTDSGDHHAQTRDQTTHLTLEDMTSFHRYGIARQTTEAVRYLRDEVDVAVHRDREPPLEGLALAMENTTAQDEMTYDWALVRPFVFPEPTTTIVRDGSREGGAASRWRYRRILAFRADAWASSSYAETRPGIEVKEPEFMPLVSLGVEAPVTPTADLVIQSVRVSGDGSADGRKVGEVRVDGVPILATAHKTTRGTSSSGFHHVAGVVDVRTSSAATRYENGCRSPDGIGVRCADGAIVVLRH